MRYISLFSGIGGVDLGLDRAGMKCVAQVEQNKFALKVLNKHWPDVPKFEDVREYDPEPGECEVVAGGFPCQDISNAANNRQGLGGERSGLWWEMLRIIERAKPAFVFIENVSQLRRMGLGIEAGCSLLPTPTASTGSLEEIMSPDFQWLIDQNGLPRRHSVKAGGSFSAGLSRLTRLWTFLPVIPELTEGLMGFPIGWTDCEDAETL